LGLLARTKKELLWSAALTLSDLFLTVLSLLEGTTDWLPLSRGFTDMLLLLLATPVLFVAGRRFFVGFWRATRNRTADMNSLVALGTGAAAVLFP
jgi:Cu+-exporting ATPase